MIRFPDLHVGGRLLVELPAKPGSHLPSGLRELAHRETKTIAAARWASRVTSSVATLRVRLRLHESMQKNQAFEDTHLRRREAPD